MLRGPKHATRSADVCMGRHGNKCSAHALHSMHFMLDQTLADMWFCAHAACCTLPYFLMTPLTWMVESRSAAARSFPSGLMRTHSTSSASWCVLPCTSL